MMLMTDEEAPVRAGRSNTEMILSEITAMRKDQAALRAEVVELRKEQKTCYGDQCKVVTDESKATETRLAEVDKKMEALKAELSKKVTEDGMLTRALQYRQLAQNIKEEAASNSPKKAKCPKCGKEEELPSDLPNGAILQCEKCGHKVKFEAGSEDESEDAGDEEPAEESEEPEA